jgi:ADP-ribose pyrophosphatase
MVAMLPPIHVHARRGRPRGYPARFPVPDDNVRWETPFPAYAPPYHVDAAVLAQDRTQNPRGWADPEDIERLTRAFASFEGTVAFDERGRPRNPRGRTGLAGRGLLGSWGANFAADPIVTRLAPNGGPIELILIERRDSGRWALPGGMAERGESSAHTAARELEEEAGVALDFGEATEVWRGYVDDARNTDHAWMETVARHLHLEGSRSLSLRAGDDARAVRWSPLDRELLDGLWADHGLFVRAALALTLETGSVPELSQRRAEIERLLP